MLHSKLILIAAIALIVRLRQVHSDGQYSSGSISIDWMESSDTSTKFTMSSVAMKTSSFFAFAFSTDNQMVNKR